MMKTISISIDEATLGSLDQLAQAHARGNRSAWVREALVEYLTGRADQEQEALERVVITKHRVLLARQTKAMVGEQSQP